MAFGINGMTETGRRGTFQWFSSYINLTLDILLNVGQNNNAVKFNSEVEIIQWELKSAANANEMKYVRESSMLRGSCLWNVALKASR